MRKPHRHNRGHRWGTRNQDKAWQLTKFRREEAKRRQQGPADVFISALFIPYLAKTPSGRVPWQLETPTVSPAVNRTRALFLPFVRRKAKERVVTSEKEPTLDAAPASHYDQLPDSLMTLFICCWLSTKSGIPARLLLLPRLCTRSRVAKVARGKMDSKGKDGHSQPAYAHESRPRKRPCIEAGESVGPGFREHLLVLMEKATRMASDDVARLKLRVDAMDDIEDRLYSSLSRLMEKYTKPVELDMLRITSLESTIANTQQVDLPRISKLELNHAHQQQQLELLSSSHNKSLEVELPRITKMELLIAQMQQQLECLGSSQTKALEEESMARSSIASRLKELEDHVSSSAQRMVTKEEDWTSKLDISVRLDELKSDVSLLKKISSDTCADGSAVTLNLKGVKEQLSTLHESLKDRWGGLESRLGGWEERIRLLIQDSEAKVAELDGLFTSTVREFESNVCTNFTAKVKELEAYLKSHIEINLQTHYSVKENDFKANLLLEAKRFEGNMRTDLGGKYKELKSSVLGKASELEERLQGLEESDGASRELQAWLESKIAKVEESVESQIKAINKLEYTIQMFAEEMSQLEGHHKSAGSTMKLLGCEIGGPPEKTVDSKLLDMSHELMSMDDHFTLELNDIKAKVEEHWKHVESRLKRTEDESTMPISKMKNYEMTMARLLTRISSLDSSLVSLKSSCLAKEAEYLQKFSDFETTNDFIATKVMELSPTNETSTKPAAN